MQTKMDDKLYLFGELIGITFQIRDDLFDYRKQIENLLELILKIKNDFTLIHVINKASLKDRNWI